MKGILILTPKELTAYIEQHQAKLFFNFGFQIKGMPAIEVFKTKENTYFLHWWYLDSKGQYRNFIAQFGMDE